MAKHSMETKKKMADETFSRVKDADILIVTNYNGLSAQDMNMLRRELREISAEYLVVKDSIAKRAIGKGQNSGIAEMIEGETGIAIDKKGDPTCISKVLVKFAKDHNFLKIHGGIIKGDLISKDDVKQLAALPSREVLLAKLANVLNAPIQGLAGALNAIICKLVYALNAVKDKKDKPQTENKEGQNGG
ncbi:MAG: 50S ribosomal protein L10 [Candidatus Omnitrophica bacterium]|nr:50S ribosomal protein L10 [Candidatus Omnitrophota bacterium]